MQYKSHIKELQARSPDRAKLIVELFKDAEAKYS
jgi:hypothetical protein